MAKSKLLRGSMARIYRDGGNLECNVLIPAEGAMVLRNLSPGRYLAVDEEGGQVAFEVSAFEEAATVIGGDFVGASCEPGSSSVVPAPPAEELPEPIYPEVAAKTPVRMADVGADIDRVPGSPGAGHVTEVEPVAEAA